VLRFHPAIAPVKIAVLPLSKKLGDEAYKIYEMLIKKYNCEYDETGSIGKRYRRQDEIGTPYCVTFDFDSLNDRCVTVRDRDSMQQVRIKIDELLSSYILDYTYRNRKICSQQIPIFNHCRFLSVAGSMTVFSPVMSIFFPLFNGQISNGSPYAILLKNNRQWTYILILTVHYSLSGALFAGAALTISTFIPNKFSTLAAPIVIYFVLMRLTAYAQIPDFLKLNILVEGICPDVTPSAAFCIS